MGKHRQRDEPPPSEPPWATSATVALPVLDSGLTRLVRPFVVAKPGRR